MGEEVERLEDHADVGTQLRECRALLGQLLAVDRDRARVDGLEAVDRAAERRLARPARPDDDDDLAAIDDRVDVLQHVQVAEVLVRRASTTTRGSPRRTEMFDVAGSGWVGCIPPKLGRSDGVAHDGTTRRSARGYRFVTASGCAARRRSRRGRRMPRSRGSSTRRARRSARSRRDRPAPAARRAARAPRCRTATPSAASSTPSVRTVEQVVALDVGGEHLQARRAGARRARLRARRRPRRAGGRSIRSSTRTTFGL